MKAKYVEKIINRKGVTCAMLTALGFPKDKEPNSLTLREAFVGYDQLVKKYNKEIPVSAVGLYNYFETKLGTGLKQLLAGVRKFKLNLICRDDIAYISDTAGIVCNKWNLGIHSQEDLDFELVKKEIYSRKC
jgi:hypothetical protein